MPRYKQEKKKNRKGFLGLLLLLISILLIITSSLAMFSDTLSGTLFATAGTLDIEKIGEDAIQYFTIEGVEDSLLVQNGEVKNLNPGDIVDGGFEVINNGNKSAYLRTTITLTVMGENLPDDILDNLFIVPYYEEDLELQRKALRGGMLDKAVTFILNEDLSTENKKVYEYVMTIDELKILNGKEGLLGRETEYENGGIDSFLARYLLYFNSTATNQYQKIHIDYDIRVDAMQYRNNNMEEWLVIGDSNVSIGDDYYTKVPAVPTIEISTVLYQDLYIKSDQNPITITATSASPDVTYIWDGRPSETQYYSLGEHTIKVKAVSPTGIESDWATITFTVRENTPPETPIITTEPVPNGGKFKSLSSTRTRIVTFYPSSTDIDGDDITYIWENLYDGVLHDTWETTGGEYPSHEYPVGHYSVRVKAIDASLAESSWTTFSFDVTADNAVAMNVGAATANGHTANFDIWGMDGSTKVITSYGNQGYGSYLKVGTDVPSASNMPMITAWPKTTDGVTVNRVQTLDEVTNYVTITWTVTNNNATEEIISLACYVDVKILNDDDAPLEKTSTGMKMTSKDNKYVFNLLLKNMPGVTNVDTMYFEKYSKGPTGYVPKLSEVSENSCSGFDSVLEFAWVNRIIGPGQTQIYTIKIGIE